MSVGGGVVRSRGGRGHSGRGSRPWRRDGAELDAGEGQQMPVWIFRAVERAGPVALYRIAEAVGAAAFVCLALAGVLASGAFMANFVAHGTFAQLFSGGTVPLFNAAVAVEIAASVIVLVVTFLEQEILVHRTEQR